jgi:hypothetical protein
MKKIADIIAHDFWEYHSVNGRKRISEIVIGRPRRDVKDRHGDWYCPIVITGFLSKVTNIFGVGPVDALLNAMKLVQAFQDKVGSVSPRARPNKPLHRIGNKSGSR